MLIGVMTVDDVVELTDYVSEVTSRTALKQWGFYVLGIALAMCVFGFVRGTALALFAAFVVFLLFLVAAKRSQLLEIPHARLNSYLQQTTNKKFPQVQWSLEQMERIFCLVCRPTDAAGRVVPTAVLGEVNKIIGGNLTDAPAYPWLDLEAEEEGAGGAPALAPAPAPVEGPSRSLEDGDAAPPQAVALGGGRQDGHPSPQAAARSPEPALAVAAPPPLGVPQPEGGWQQQECKDVVPLAMYTELQQQLQEQLRERESELLDARSILETKDDQGRTLLERLAASEERERMDAMRINLLNKQYSAMVATFSDKDLLSTATPPASPLDSPSRTPRRQT